MALPINFHKTFIPERRLISNLLRYAAEGKSGDYQTIAAATGIPMGKSNGKVPAILDYARGMGLITLNQNSKSAVKEPQLTGFGRIVYLEDILMGEKITQWLAHMHLSHPNIGSKAWNQVFSGGRRILGKTFSYEQLEIFLISSFGKGKNRTGPLVRMYLDDAAFARASILKSDKDIIICNKAPLSEEFALPYAAYVLQLIECHFRDQLQVSTTDLNTRTGWFKVCLWEDSDIERALNLIERTGYISIDRLTRPWVLHRMIEAIQVWPKIYCDLA